MTDNILTFRAHHAAGHERRYSSLALHDQSSLSGLQRCGVAISRTSGQRGPDKVRTSPPGAEL